MTEGIIVLFGVLVLLVVFYMLLQEDEADKELRRMEEAAKERQRLRMARMGDEESRLMEVAKTGELPQVEKPKRKPGRPKKAA